jgi:hypothetical protein
MQALFETRLSGGVRWGKKATSGSSLERLNLRRERWPATPVFGKPGLADYAVH